MHWTSLRLACLFGATLALAAACIVDSDKPCDRGRVELKGVITGCICEPGSVPAPDNTSCIPCAGEHEEAANGVCQCTGGYMRVGSRCMPEVDAGSSPQADAGPIAPTGQDTPCTAQADCMEFAADFCLPFPGAMTCAVRNCAKGAQTCAADRVCCDVSGANGIFPDLTMADGVCIVAPACAMGGKVVTP